MFPLSRVPGGREWQVRLIRRWTRGLLVCRRLLGLSGIKAIFKDDHLSLATTREVCIG